MLSHARVFLFVISLVIPVAAIAQSDAPTTPPFSLPALPYADDALAPVIDVQTMRIHHGRHHRAYVENLNKRLAELPALANTDQERLLAEVSQHDATIRNNAGGHFNHSLFWQVMAPSGKGGTPSAALQAQIARDFGSHDAFVKQFETAARGVFGSGWAWLILTPEGKLAVTATANQDNPLMDVVAQRGVPLLALDIWEHAYYLQYQNKRQDYVSAWWKVVNWNEVSRRHAKAIR